MVKKEVLHEYTFDYIGVRTVKASSFEEASKMADMEMPTDFTIELIGTNDPKREEKMGWKKR
jgi:hypothetical protein